MKISKIILIALLFVFIGQMVYFYSLLPETVATHFDASGKADGWMSKQGFIIFEFVLLLLIIGQFLLLPSLIEKLPNSWINLPNKDYWLAEERRARTFALFRNFFEWLSVALLILFIAVNYLIFKANIENQNLSIVASWTIIILFITFVIVWLIKFILFFRVKR